MSERTDAELWEAARRGNAEAYGVLYERHVHAIYNYLFRRLADWSEAEDMTAVVFLEAFRRRNDVRPSEGKVLPWLYGVATNVLRNRRRSLWYHATRYAALLSIRRHQNTRTRLASDSTLRRRCAKSCGGCASFPRASKTLSLSVSGQG